MLNSRNAVAGLICTALLSGCAPSYRWAKTTSVQADARESSCSFDILTARPDRAFDELGVLEKEWDTNQVDGFRASTQAQVCAAGGDAVLVEVNGLGHYVRGTVIRYRPVTAADTAQ
ncbi:MAG: hypothetical protein L0Y64_00470 [Myxococcaceae bacterium]|nr:hypothetical protein [Myxococcaceae bacterium]